MMDESLDSTIDNNEIEIEENDELKELPQGSCITGPRTFGALLRNRSWESDPIVTEVTFDPVSL